MTGEIDISVIALKGMNAEQFICLKNNILADGLWENARKAIIRLNVDHIGVSLRDGNDVEMIYIGIEKDGYTHS